MSGKAAAGVSAVMFGIGVCFALLHMFFFGTAGSVEVLTLGFGCVALSVGAFRAVRFGLQRLG